MLKFNNRDMKTGEEWEYRLSMDSMLCGVLVRACKCHPGDEESVCDQVVLTPMDAAAMAFSLGSYGFCPDLGHGEDSMTMSVEKYHPADTFVGFVGGIPDAWIKVGKIEMVVPDFVVKALASALNGMMPQMMWPSTGRDEEEFG